MQDSNIWGSILGSLFLWVSSNRGVVKVVVNFQNTPTTRGCTSFHVGAGFVDPARGSSNPVPSSSLRGP